MIVNTRKMNTDQIKRFTNHLCSIQFRGSNLISKVMSVHRQDGITKSTGEYPEHWTDEWHEEDGGDDVRRDRPKIGAMLLKAKMDGLSYKGGYEAAWDDVSNEDLTKSTQEERSSEFDGWT